MAMAFTVRKLLLFSSLLLLPILVLSQTNGRIKVGDSLTATPGNSSWISPSGDFAFGFSKIENNDSFLLSIWYAKIPERTIVWYARTDDMPALAPTGSTVNLTSDSGLVLKSPQGGLLWNSSITSPGSVVANGIMNDTGNFVLVDGSSESLWQSFDHPTDTMLPGQAVEKGGKLSPRKMLSETNDTCQSGLEDSHGGFCGYNSICTPTVGMPNCTCPRGFSLLDPNKPNGGCKPDFIQGCKGELSQKEDMYEVLQLSAVNFPFSDYAILKNLTEEKCNESCYGDCWCAAAVFNTELATCWKKSLPLLNGRRDSSVTQTFIKVGKNNSTLCL